MEAGDIPVSSSAWATYKTCLDIDDLNLAEIHTQNIAGLTRFEAHSIKRANDSKRTFYHLRIAQVCSRGSAMLGACNLAC